MKTTSPCLVASEILKACLRRERESLDGRRRKLQDEKSMDEWSKDLSQEIDQEERKLDELAREDCQVGLVLALGSLD